MKRVKHLVIGQARNPTDRGIFHNITLIALFAWVGLGADGLSSSCYGPEQTFLALGKYPSLSLFVALAMAATIFVISESYSQIIELFPSGGGGYLVASKLLSPTTGMISGCALLIDYVLTIAISIASSADALFSFFPVAYQPLKIYFAIGGVLLLMIMNMRGVKESVISLVPVFMIFIVTHFIAIVYALVVHLAGFTQVFHSVSTDMSTAHSEMGLWGIIFLILRSYGMGAGTYTGIEAVSNGLPILREPRVQTAKKTMRYMALSLAFTATGLMIAYLLFNVSAQPGKTLNAVLFESIVREWPGGGYGFVLTALFSEAALLFVAAQAGFVDGPRVLANMAVDRWFPNRFASLSDRLVTQNGVMLMGVAAAATIIFTQGLVQMLVVLYSINVFITFCLSQLGMVRHWWQVRREERKWKKRITINGAGLVLTSFILLSMVILKFHEGGWITLVLTGTIVLLAIFIKRHYYLTGKLLRRLNDLVQTVSAELKDDAKVPKVHQEPDHQAKTAVLLVNGFNGLGLHTLFGVMRLFGSSFKNFVFVEVGVIDAGNFKGAQEVDRLKEHAQSDIKRYITFMRQNGFYAEGISRVGIDVIDEVEKASQDIITRFPNVVFFGGQLVFPEETFFTRVLHNHTVFALQRKFYYTGTPFVLLPIRV
ncbi:MAG: APC family permease [Candidatus Omnitrophota bacterium]